MKNLQRYVYFQCLPKIKERLSATAPGLQGGEFEGLFRRLSPTDVADGWVPPVTELPGTMESRDEAWLIDYILFQSLSNNVDTARTDIPTEPRRDIEQLAVSAWSAQATVVLLKEALQNIRTSVDGIELIKNRRNLPEKAKELVPVVEELLDQLSDQMHLLYKLTHHSRLMWHVIESSVVRNVFTGAVRIRVLMTNAPN